MKKSYLVALVALAFLCSMAQAGAPVSLQYNQKVLLTAHPKDGAGHDIPWGDIEGGRCETDYPPVITVIDNHDGTCWAIAHLAGSTAVRFRGADGGVDLPDDVTPITVSGPATSFNVTAGSPVSQ